MKLTISFCVMSKNPFNTTFFFLYCHHHYNMFVYLFEQKLWDVLLFCWLKDNKKHLSKNFTRDAQNNGKRREKSDEKARVGDII